MAATTVERLEEMRTALQLTMIAIKKPDLKEAERLLLIAGSLLDRTLSSIEK